jgi:hypothetical protein
MSWDLVRRSERALVRQAREHAAAASNVQRPAQLATMQINAAALATHAALLNTALLAAEEGRLIQQAPLAEPRLKAIVDAYAGYCCHTIARLAHD